ncbi:MAG: undecaprenyl-diphosphate phosphatase [Acidobacteriota bacterium]|nr:undecaprenyl-diphosphate phosphatase [Acidobacteriota bacterium]
MTLLQAAVLGVVQGLTEFLPVSSSAHLIVVRDLFGWDSGAAEIPFDVVCHLGTVLAVLVYFRDDVSALVAAAPQMIMGHPGQTARLGRLIVIATVPLVLTGWLFADVIGRLRTPAVAAAALSVGAVAMILAERMGSQRRASASLSAAEAAGLGLAQAVALVPGVSRSGAVMTVALWTGLRREEGARFAFLIGIPAILGAGARTAWTLGSTGLAEYTMVLLVGFAVSGVVGYLAVAGLLRYLASHSLAPFALYRLAVAAALGIWLVV